ncbi:MAG: hypothetical protein WD036_00695 [Bauldia sp.]
MKDILAELEARSARARLGGGEKRIAEQHKLGKSIAVHPDEGSFEDFGTFVEYRDFDFGMAEAVIAFVAGNSARGIPIIGSGKRERLSIYLVNRQPA